MPFMYSPLFNASNSRRILCLSYSRLGQYIVVGASNCLTVWSIAEGTPLVDDLRMFSDPLSITWISELIFVVGCSDGSLFSLQVIPEEKRVQLFGFFASTGPIQHLSSNVTGTLLVSASLNKICSWAQTKSKFVFLQYLDDRISLQLLEKGQIPQIHWSPRNTLYGSANQDGSTQKLVSLTCFTKLEHRLRSVLLIYEHHIKILDIDILSTVREYYLPKLIISGALLHNETSAMTVDVSGEIRILNFETGIFTKLQKSRNIPASVRFIHGEHLMIIGGDGRADIVDAELMHKVQTLWHIERNDTSTFSRSLSWHLPRRPLHKVNTSEIDLLSDYCSDPDEMYLIATVSSKNGQVMVWKGAYKQLFNSSRAWFSLSQFLWTMIYFLPLIGVLLIAILMGDDKRHAIVAACRSAFNYR